MTSDTPDNLEKQLTDLTTWTHPAPQLWRQALRTARPGTVRWDRLWQRMTTWPVPAVAAACLAVAAIATGIFMQLPKRSQPASSVTFTQYPPLETLSDSAGRAFSEAASVGRRYGSAEVTRASLGQRSAGPMTVSQAADKYPAASLAVRLDHSLLLDRHAQPAPVRQVVRNVAIEIAAADVRAAYLKALHLISAAHGEYVQDSALHGQGNSAQAELTLRVAVDRLSEVLDRLRDLGEVRSERGNSDDVTDQAVDLDARIRNEQRIETELLELVESRKDAPLKEILELRDKLAEVRRSIERLTGQRERLDRLTALATVLVIIRTTDAPPVPQANSLVDYFDKALRSAWRAGLQFLADTFAVVLSVLIGGVVWWVVLAAVIVAVVRYRRRTATKVGDSEV